ncbi:hypothetical protein O59_003608 [Cellvibrio sp. BR]|nr:hypothetical protein O59_003608 [Cellvibrio sp. BR]
MVLIVMFGCHGDRELAVRRTKFLIGIKRVVLITQRSLKQISQFSFVNPAFLMGIQVGLSNGLLVQCLKFR